MEIIGRYVLVEDVKTYYEEIGDVKKQAIVCLHTAGRDSRQWHQVMDLLKEKYYIVALDMPGHSKSWPKTNTTCIDQGEEYANFIIQFTKSLKLVKPIFIGCSVGGNMVLKLATDYPADVKVIVCLQGCDYTPTISMNALEMITHPYVNYTLSNLDFSESLIGKRCKGENKSFLLYTIFQSHPFSLKADLTVYTNFDLRKKINRITCPVLMIRGTDDWLVTSEMVAETFSRLVSTEKKELVELEGLGHFPHVEDGELIVSVIKTFLEKYEEAIK